MGPVGNELRGANRDEASFRKWRAVNFDVSQDIVFLITSGYAMQFMLPCVTDTPMGVKVLHLVSCSRPMTLCCQYHVFMTKTIMG